MVGEASNELLLISAHDPSQHFRMPTSKSDKTIGLKLTDKLLVRSGVEGTVTLWDARLLGKSAPIHTFNRTSLSIQALAASSTRWMSASTSSLVVLPRRWCSGT